MQAFRNFLLGRKLTSQLRYETMDGFVTRDQPPPNIPVGPHDKLSANNYYQRDGRREAQPPVMIASNSTLKSLESGLKSSESSNAVAVKKPVTPGNVFHWD